MPNYLRSGFRELFIIVLLTSVSPVSFWSTAPQGRDSLQLIPGTTLRVALPANWQLDRAVPIGSPQLKYVSKPEYTLMVSQANSRTTGHSCIDLIGSMQAVPGLGATISPRPRYIPEVYFGSVVEIPKAQLTCLSVGTGPVGVMIRLGQGDAKPDLLTAMLASISEAAVTQSSTVSAPASLKLSRLEIEIPLRKGAWGVRPVTDQWGTNDILGRVGQAGNNELHITPFIFKQPGRCDSLMRNPPFAGARLAKGPAYAGLRWHRDAVEQLPPPFKALQAYACRNVGQNSILLARIDYEKSAVSDTDGPLIRQMLDDIGDAVDRKLSGK